MSKQFYTAQEVAEHFKHVGIGMTQESVLRLARLGRIPRILISAKTIRFDLDDVVAAIRNGVPAEPTP